MLNKPNNRHINHLGSYTEQLLVDGDSIESNLPKLFNRLRTLQQATEEVKSIMVGSLPSQILDNCWVVNLSDESLTLAVTSTTAANHIYYLKQAYIKILREQSFSFTQIQDLKVIVNHK